MLNFRNTRILFAAALLVLLALDLSYPVPFWSYLVLGVAWLLLLFIGSCNIQSGFFLKAYCAGNNKDEIAITFDDGPHENTGKILEVLERYKLPAAFFCIGKNISGREKIVRKIHDAGHLTGNHSYSHSNYFDFFPLHKLEEDVSKTDDLLYNITGTRNVFFRPPFGVTTPDIARLVKKNQYHVIGWSLRSYDTTIKNRKKMLNRILTRLRPGSVILLHDTTPGIEEVLEKIILFAGEKNLKIVRVDKMLGIS